MSQVYTLQQLHEEEVNFNNLRELQFTGLKDKNRIEVCEGDVIKTPSGIGYIVYEDSGFAIKSPGSEAVDWELSGYYLECEIIGNIYENPELINL